MISFEKTKTVIRLNDLAIAIEKEQNRIESAGK